MKAKKEKWSFKKWYHEGGGKKKLAEKRKAIYAKDPEYRKKVLEASKDYYNKTKKRLVPKDRTIIRASKGGILFFSIGRLAKAVKRGTSTIRQYHDSGVLPAPLYFDKRGWRLYTEDQIAMLMEVFARFDDGKIPSLTELSKEVNSNWKC